MWQYSRRVSFLNRLRLEWPGVPDPGRVVDAPGDQAMAVGTEGQAAHSCGVAAERDHLAALLGFPELDRKVLVTACRDPSAVRAEGHAMHGAGVPPEAEHPA